MQCLGIHVEEEGVVAALVAKEKKSFVIKSLESTSSDGTRLALLQNIQISKKYFTSSALDTAQVLIRTIDIPLKHIRAIYKALPFQLEQLTAHSAEDAIVIPLIYKEKSGSTVKVFCSTKQNCKHHLERCQKHSIDPDWIGCIPQALYRFTKHYAQRDSVITIHMGLSSTHAIAIQEGKLFYALQIDIGKEKLFKELRKDLPSEKEESLEKLFSQEIMERKDLKNVHNVLQKFLQELDRLLYFLFQHKKEISLQEIFLTREDLFLKQCLHCIERSQGYQLRYVDVQDKEHTSLKPYAVAIGQALDVLSQDSKSLQFRTTQTLFLQKELTRKLRLYLYSFLGALCVFIMSWQLFLKMQEGALKTKLFSLLDLYAQEIEGLSPKESLKKTLEAVEKKLSLIKKPYGYYSTPTRVQEFLEQLQIASEKEKMQDLFTLQKLHYELVSYPSLQDPVQSYKIQIKLELETENPEKMEKFLQTFCEASIVSKDPSPQILYAAGRYEVTVFLAAS